MATAKHSVTSWAGRAITVLAPLVLIAKREARMRQQERDIMTATPKYPDVTVYLPMGDPPFVIQRVCAALDAAGVPRSEINEFIEDALSEDYGHLLVTVARWVTVP